MSSILVSTKELLGVPFDNTDFDFVLMMHINSVITTLNQLGVVTEQSVLYTGAPASGTPASGTPWISTDTMEDLLPEDESIHSVVQMYIYTKVRLVFDPPTSSFVLSALEKIINEYEFRLLDYTKNKE